MPTKGLRYTNKVDLEKEAATDKFLHVRAPGDCYFSGNNY
jgi:hypothetical protein